MSIQFSQLFGPLSGANKSVNSVNYSATFHYDTRLSIQFSHSAFPRDVPQSINSVIRSHGHSQLIQSFGGRPQELLIKFIRHICPQLKKISSLIRHKNHSAHYPGPLFKSVIKLVPCSLAVQPVLELRGQTESCNAGPRGLVWYIYCFYCVSVFFKGYPTIKLLCNAMCCVLCLLVSFSLSCQVPTFVPLVSQSSLFFFSGLVRSIAPPPPALPHLFIERR